MLESTTLDLAFSYRPDKYASLNGVTGLVSVCSSKLTFLILLTSLSIGVTWQVSTLFKL